MTYESIESRALARTFEQLGPEFDPTNDDHVRLVRGTFVYAHIRLAVAIEDFKAVLRHHIQQDLARLARLAGHR